MSWDTNISQTDLGMAESVSRTFVGATSRFDSVSGVVKDHVSGVNIPTLECLESIPA